jgi:hypothetical protein
MPNNITVKNIVVGIIIGFALVSLFKQTSDSSSIKNNFLKPSKEIIVRTYKMLSPFKVEIINELNEPIQKDQIFKLTATIESTTPKSNVNYSWILPKGVIAAAGTPLKGSIAEINSKDTIQLKGAFVSHSDHNEIIHLKLWTNDKSGHMVSGAQFQTLRQNDLNNQKLELSKRQDEYLLDHPELLKQFK